MTSIEIAIEKVKAYIYQKCIKEPGYVVDIHIWPLNEWIGIRVAEVSISNDTSGASWMQSDIPHGLAVCAQTERVLLAYVTDSDDPDSELLSLGELL